MWRGSTSPQLMHEEEHIAYDCIGLHGGCRNMWTPSERNAKVKFHADHGKLFQATNTSNSELFQTANGTTGENNASESDSIQAANGTTGKNNSSEGDSIQAANGTTGKVTPLKVILFKQLVGLLLKTTLLDTHSGQINPTIVHLLPKLNLWELV